MMQIKESGTTREREEEEHWGLTSKGKETAGDGERLGRVEREGERERERQGERERERVDERKTER